MVSKILVVWNTFNLDGPKKKGLCLLSRRTANKIVFIQEGDFLNARKENPQPHIVAFISLFCDTGRGQDYHWFYSEYIAGIPSIFNNWLLKYIARMSMITSKELVKSSLLIQVMCHNGDSFINYAGWNNM